MQKLNLARLVAPVRIAIAMLATVLIGCTTNPTSDETISYPAEETRLPPANAKPGAASAPSADPNAALMTMLGMQRDQTELGFTEKSYNPCEYNPAQVEGCTERYFSVVHFQLFCRDTEGSVQDVPVQIEPITSDAVTWQLNSINGSAPTDAKGYGHFMLASPTTNREQRLILRIGPQFIGLNVSEVTKIILPNNYCHRGAK